MALFKWSLVCLMALPAIGCGAAEQGTEDAEIGSVEQAVSFTGHDPIWWQDVIDDSANVTMGANLLDQFLVQNGVINHWRSNSGSWSFGSTFPAPAAGVKIKAVSAVNSGGRIDLFAVGSDNKVWRRVSNTGAGFPNFGAWSQVANVGTVKSDGLAGIAATSWGAGRIDLFWITSANVIGHAWFDNFGFSGFQTGANTAWLQNLPGTPSGLLEAVSSASGRIDLFVMTGTEKFMIHHHSWNNGSFGRAEYSATGPGIVNSDPDLKITSLAVGSTGPGQISLFVRPLLNQVTDPKKGLQVVNFNGLQPNQSKLFFSAPENVVPASPAQAPVVLKDVVRRTEGGVVRNELWAAGDYTSALQYSVWFGD